MISWLWDRSSARRLPAIHVEGPCARQNKRAALRRPFSKICRAALFRGAALRGLRLVTALGSLLAFDVLTGGLSHYLHGQAHFAALVHAEELHFHLVAFLDDIADLVHPARCKLADVHQPVLGAEEVHEGAEVHDLHYGAFVDVADFRIGSDRLDPVDRRLDRVAIGGGDLDGTVVLDVDLGTCLFDDLADHLAACTDYLADLVGRDLEHFDARSMFAEFCARRSEGLAHLTENVHAAVLRLRERDLHDLLGDAGDLDVHLQGCDTLIGAGHLEIHVAEMVFVAKDVG